jgi:hypothetical protein
MGIVESVSLRMPEKTSLPEDQQHFLLYIPWNKKYLDFVPEKYKQKFTECLPLLSARTTNVHVAVCFRYFDEMVEAFPGIDRSAVAMALILHDTGWSRLTEEEIATSLGVKGLKLTIEAMVPKEKHAVIGEEIAREKLTEWRIDKDRADLVCACVRWHDNPSKVTSLEIKVLADLDHLWSFTQENFWQDVQRKGVDAAAYVANLGNDLDGYFVTDNGKNIARRLLGERRHEVECN